MRLACDTVEVWDDVGIFTWYRPLCSWAVVMIEDGGGGRGGRQMKAWSF